MIGEVQSVEERLDAPVGRPQRQQQGPDQGEGQLAGRIARQPGHLRAQELGHIGGQHLIEEAELPPGVGWIGEQAVDGDEGAQRREQGQQHEEGHAPGDKADPVAEIAHDRAPQDIDPALVWNLRRPLGQTPASRLLGVIVLGRWIGRGQDFRARRPQLKTEAVALRVKQVGCGRAGRQSAGRSRQIAQQSARALRRGT